MSELRVDKISPRSGTALQIGDASDVITIPASATITNLGTATGFGGGLTLQVVQNHLITGVSQAHSAATRYNISGLNASITPASTGSKILVKVRWCGEHGIAPEDGYFGIKRDTTDIGNPDPAAAGNRNIAIMNSSLSYSYSDMDSTTESSVYEYIDAPSSTSSITYHATYWNKSAGTLYTCRTKGDSNNPWMERVTSSITLIELSAATLLVDGS